MGKTKGAPEKCTSPSRAFNMQQVDSSSIDLNSVAQRLTREEASSFIDLLNKRFYFVSSADGLRACEISGLQVCNIDANADLLFICHSWNDTDKLKDTKNGDNRIIPNEQGVALELLINARQNPDYSDTSFVFWSQKVEGQPMWPSSFEDDFYIAMQKIGISEEQRVVEK